MADAEDDFEAFHALKTENEVLKSSVSYLEDELRSMAVMLRHVIQRLAEAEKKLQNLKVR
jgi:hypothetical protein